MEDILYSVAEVAKLLKTNNHYIYELIKKRITSSIKVRML